MTSDRVTSPSPRRIRPYLPKEWHVPNDPRLWITWKHARRKLGGEEVYWVSTTRPDGRPHAAPVWGVWRKSLFFFETDPHSVKGVNIAKNPNIVIHVQDGNDTVIVEGRATLEPAKGRLKSLQAAYSRKYGYTPDWSGFGQILYRVNPNVAHAWRNPRMHRSLVNFLF